MPLWHAALLALVSMALAAIEPGMMRLLSSEMTFVSRPDLRPPRWNITTSNAERLSPGYWFIAPYADLGAQSGSASSCQIGPHIYDDEGVYKQLVWSGACDVHNRNTFDFKTWETAGVRGLSFVVEGQSTGLDMWHKRGAGLVLGDTYALVDAVDPVDPADNIREFNFHEFTKLPNGIGSLVMYDNSSTIANTEVGDLLVCEGGFLQFDPEGKTTFQWRALDHIDVPESTEIRPEGGSKTEWDWFHANSVDRNSNGDYLLSARHTDCIYKISGHDGSIIWRLGGLNSTFTLADFTFSRQHDARFVPSEDRHDGKELISFLNNAADSHHNTSATSAAYLVEVDTNGGTARLSKQWLRPDGKLGVYRGNVQFLDNGNVFVYWGDNG